MPIVGKINQYGSFESNEFDEISSNKISITGLGTYFSTEFIENIGITTLLSANIYSPYNNITGDFCEVLYGPGNGTYMRHNVDNSVVVYNEIDEINFLPVYTINPSAKSVNEGNSVNFSVITTNVDDGTNLYYEIVSPISCTITPSTTSFNEGSSISFLINTVNVDIGSSIYYDIVGLGTGIKSADFTDGTLTGVATITSGFSATITKVSMVDLTTEGNEYFNLNVRITSNTGPIIATSPLIKINDTSIGNGSLYSFTSHTFTTGGATGRNGPTSFASVSSYTSTSWYSSYFSVSSGIQSWIVPRTGTYTIVAKGAAGGLNNGGTFYPGAPGEGAIIQGNIYLVAGDVLSIVVGQKGVYGANGSSGGGGTFVYTGSIGGAGLLIAAGGGGGWGHGSSNFTSGALGGGGSATSTPTTGYSSAGNAGSKGTGQGGLGGNYSYGSAGGGAGWLSDGDNGQGGGAYTYISFGGTRWIGGLANGTGAAAYTGDGGFGGGAGWGGNNGAAGGAGGYSGGGGGNGYNGSSWGAGGGGGSYNSGTSQVNTAGTQGSSTSTDGYVTITLI